jgi:hypothetical protein
MLIAWMSVWLRRARLMRLHIVARGSETGIAPPKFLLIGEFG